MAEFVSADLGIATNELFSPDYVCFDCKVWDLPDNTIGQKGCHVVYRPLCSGHEWDALYAPNPAPVYRGTEVVTEEMRTTVSTHYARECAAQKSAQVEAAETSIAASMAIVAAAGIIAATPAVAQQEMAAAVRKHTALWDMINEGGEGYVPLIGWDTTEGHDIAERHGLDAERIAMAGRIVRGG